MTARHHISDPLCACQGPDIMGITPIESFFGSVHVDFPDDTRATDVAIAILNTDIKNIRDQITVATRLGESPSGHCEFDDEYHVWMKKASLSVQVKRVQVQKLLAYRWVQNPPPVSKLLQTINHWKNKYEWEKDKRTKGETVIPLPAVDPALKGNKKLHADIARLKNHILEQDAAIRKYKKKESSGFKMRSSRVQNMTSWLRQIIDKGDDFSKALALSALESDRRMLDGLLDTSD